MFKTNFRQSLAQYHLAHHLHRLLKYVDFSWNFFGHHNLLVFVDEYVIKMSIIFFCSQNSKLVHKNESLSLNTRQGS